MPNTSATGGYVAPTTTMGELDDQALARFLQGVVVGIVGLAPTLVRPRWQPEPPNYPDYGTDWAAIGELQRSRDCFATVVRQPTVNGDGQDAEYRTEILEIICSFYGPNAKFNSEMLAMGLGISQNRETMQGQGYSLIEVEDSVTTTDLINSKWVPREDTKFRLRRAQLFKYPILNLTGAQGTVVDDTGSVNSAFTVQSAKAPSSLPLFGWGMDSNTIAGWGKGSWQ